MAIRLYAWPRSAGTRVAWALEELSLAYEYVQLDAAKLEHRSADYLAISPMGKVPALVDDEQRLFESGAILLHLGGKYGVSRQLWPDGSGQDRADALSWTVWAMAEFGPYLMQVLYHGMDTPISYRPEDRSAAAAAFCRSQLQRGLDALEARLQTREHLLGSFTLADIGAASWLMLGTGFGLELSNHPRVDAWLKGCAARPAQQRARADR